jgi:leader peptidase (prepilin peptidase)/N-methyltransferase
MLSDVAALYTESPALFAGSVFVIGLVVGSFLNVVIYRLPIMLEREWRTQAADLTAAAQGDAPIAPTATTPPIQVSPLPAFTLSTPRSACPVCKAPIKSWQNIPLVSWLALGGRCASCKTKISVRYPLVELATGILSAWAAWHFGFGPAAACAVVVTWALIALTGIDIDRDFSRQWLSATPTPFRYRSLPATPPSAQRLAT